MPSSVIRDFAYDEDTRSLTITFVSGRRYSYLDVPPRIARGLALSTSKGGYFNRCIRDRYSHVVQRG